MGFLGKFFGKKKEENESPQSQYLPEKKSPIEIEFAENFTKRGGKFIYCENSAATAHYFKEILHENNWTLEDIESDSPILSSFFKLNSSQKSPQALAMHCEYLIANKGAILVCNRQIKEKKLSELCQNLIIVADTSAFKSDVSEAMTAINHKYTESRPSNITTLNAYDPTKENDFLSYGGNAKHLYLLVQEVNE